MRLCACESEIIRKFREIDNKLLTSESKMTKKKNVKKYTEKLQQELISEVI